MADMLFPVSLKPHRGVVMAWSIFKDGGGPLAAKGWAQQFLTKLGAPVTPGNLQFVYQWELAEGGGGKYNPLNQGPVAGHPNLTTTGSQFGGGAADFASWDAGLEGAYDYLHYDHYKNVLAGLMNNDPVAARAALWASPWAASHYGYGKNWPVNAVVPGGTAILPTGITNASSSGSSDSSATDTSFNAATCAFSYKSPIPLGGTTCLLPKSTARGILGGSILATGIIGGLVAVVLLMIYGLSGTKAGSAAISLVPGGTLARKFL